ncbi:MAG: M48 family metalloprotease [bacterium]|nr:M48 family metalloprotease [bacterium]
MYNQIADNKRKTVFILLGFVVLIAAISWLMSMYYGNGNVVYYGLIFAVVYASFGYLASSRIALAVNGAVEIEKRDNPRLWRTVENLAITNGMPMPKVYIIEDNGMNAFATGRNPEHASVAITTGLLNNLTDAELQGVMAHELGHIQNYDIRVSMIAFALVSVISLLSDFFLRMSFFGGGQSDDDDSGRMFAILGIVAIIIAPIVAILLQMALSRKREYLADATGAMTTRYPEGLASALQKIQACSSAVKRQNSSTAHLFFANPLKGGVISSLFSTHPPVEERVKRLQNMGGGF